MTILIEPLWFAACNTAAAFSLTPLTLLTSSAIVMLATIPINASHSLPCRCCLFTQARPLQLCICWRPFHFRLTSSPSIVDASATFSLTPTSAAVHMLAAIPFPFYLLSFHTSFRCHLLPHAPHGLPLQPHTCWQQCLRIRLWE